MIPQLDSVLKILNDKHRQPHLLINKWIVMVITNCLFDVGFVSSTLTNPIWFVKTRIQLNRNKKLTARQCIVSIYNKQVRTIVICNFLTVISILNPESGRKRDTQRESMDPWIHSTIHVFQHEINNASWCEKGFFPLGLHMCRFGVC